jgi:hypothetical protein
MLLRQYRYFTVLVVCVSFLFLSHYRYRTVLVVLREFFVVVEAIAVPYRTCFFLKLQF